MDVPSRLSYGGNSDLLGKIAPFGLLDATRPVKLPNDAVDGDIINDGDAGAQEVSLFGQSWRPESCSSRIVTISRKGLEGLSRKYMVPNTRWILGEP